MLLFFALNKLKDKVGDKELRSHGRMSRVWWPAYVVLAGVGPTQLEVD
jgi:hypothetical protein